MGWANDAPRCIDYQAVGGILETPDGNVFSTIAMMFQAADGEGDVMLTFVREDHHLRAFAKLVTEQVEAAIQLRKEAQLRRFRGPIKDLEAAMRIDNANAGLANFGKPSDSAEIPALESGDVAP